MHATTPGGVVSTLLFPGIGWEGSYNAPIMRVPHTSSGEAMGSTISGPSRTLTFLLTGGGISGPPAFGER